VQGRPWEPNLRREPQCISDLNTAGKLQSVMEGKHRLYRREWVDAYLNGP
jgi:hypothetical protein